MDYKTTYDEFWLEHHSVAGIPQNTRQIADEIQRLVGMGTLLEVGCGKGHLVRRLNAAGGSACGIDVSEVVVQMANQACPGRFRSGNVIQLPYDENSFDCVVGVHCLEYLLEEDIAAAIAELHRVARQAVYLRIATVPDDQARRFTVRDREWWEQRFFAVGFRKHPRHYLASPFGSLDAASDQCTIVLSKLPKGSAQKYSLQSLQEERQLHMDMSREPGRRSDAHIVRYFEAARYVRPGDRVLDAACGLGYGSTLITQNSRCASYLGIDCSAYAVDYARATFSCDADNIRFDLGSLPECLEQLEDATFDFVASFETLEHLRDPHRYLQECKRLLTPGGRLMISVPNDWAEEDGVDPNPHHFHVYSWDRILQELQDAGFHVERTIAETVSRRKENGKWANFGYEWKEHDLESVSDKPSEWCIVLAMKSPFESSHAAYTNGAFAESAGLAPSNVMDYASQYDNPWLIPSLVTRGLRTERKQLLRHFAETVIDRKEKDVDEAAALCVQAYSLLGDDADWAVVEKLLRDFEPHTCARDWSSAKPIEIRWAISLNYVGALLLLERGQRDMAKRLLEECLDIPFLRYSPILATKTVSAAIRLAKLAIVDSDLEAARRWLRRGAEASQLAAGQNWESVFGDLARQPLPVFRELTDVVELGAQCIAGLSLLQGRSPNAGYFELLDSSKSGEIEKLLAYQRTLADAIRWHQERTKVWHGASEYWQREAERLGNALESLQASTRADQLAVAESQRPAGPKWLKKLKRSVLKRAQALRYQSDIGRLPE